MRSKNPRRGSALIIVLIVMVVLASFSLANARTLTNLRKFIAQVEREQKQKFDPSAAPAEEQP